MNIIDLTIIENKDHYLLKSQVDDRSFELNIRGIEKLTSVLKEVDLYSEEALFLLNELSDFIDRKKKFDKLHITRGKLQLVTIEVLNLCNLRCKHCYIGEKNIAPIDNNNFSLVIDSVKELGAYEATLTGGEPFIDLNIIDKITYLRNNRFKVSINSNGTLITDQLAEKLSALKVSKVSISLCGNKNEHEFIYGNETYDRTLNGIEMIKRNNIPLKINVIAYQGNVNRINEIIEEIKARFLPYEIVISPVNIEGNAVKYKDKLIIEKKIQTKLKRDLNYSQKHILSPNDFGFHCGAGQSSIYIKADGSVLPCVEFPHLMLGNFFNNSIQEMLSENGSSNMSKILNFNINLLNKCKDCDFFNECLGGCRARASATGNLYSPDDDMCQLFLGYKK